MMKETRFNISATQTPFYAEEQFDVMENTTMCCQWEGVEIKGTNLEQVQCAGKHIARTLLRFKYVIP